MSSNRDAFWERTSLGETGKKTCLEALEGRYDGFLVEEVEHQGYCSFTWLLSPRKDHLESNGLAHTILPQGSEVFGQLIVQVRPAQYALDLDVAFAASRTHLLLAPTVRALDIYLPADLRAYEMNRLSGFPMSRLQYHNVATGEDPSGKQTTLITSFANIVAQSLSSVANKKRRDSALWVEPLSSQEKTIQSLCTGKVGSHIVQKIQKLSEQLPDRWLRDKAQKALDMFRLLDDYPVVLNHGDLIPSNILADEKTWKITGLVDWAEAEYLPFGTCLYGLEHLLGFLRPPSQESSSSTFVYYDNAPQLRAQFWTTLFGLTPELEGKQDEVRLMRDVGVFLWHGYAWDEGAIDRVVDEVNDDEELAKLRAFMSI